MRINDILFEGAGLKSARPGEVYTDPNGVEYKFIKWDWAHPAKQDQYPTPDSMTADIQQYTGNNPDKIVWLNKPTNALKSFAVAQFQNDAGQDLWIGKFYRSKSMSNTIADKEARLGAGLTAGRAGKKSSSAVKYENKLKPAELGLASDKPQSVQQIISVVQKHPQGPMLSQAVTEAATAKPIVFVDGAPMQSALQDDFGEVISPVAMISNHPAVKGAFAEAVKDIFKGEGLKGAGIIFPSGSNNPLVDSYIVSPSGIQMGVSSKGGVSGGAQATVTVAWKAKEEAMETATGRAYVKKFKDAAEFLDIIQANSQMTGPIVAAERYNLISPQELSALRQLMSSPKNSWIQVTGDTNQDLAQVPKELQPMFKEIAYNAGSWIPFLCLGAVARRVAKFVNNPSNPMQFGEAVRSFLNSSAMVQATAILQNQNGNPTVTSINVTYPPNFKGTAKLEPNSYAGTKVVTKFKVKMPKD